MSRTIVFVDARVTDAGQLLATLDADALVVWLDPSEDGIARMSAVLAGLHDVEAVHVLSHGSAGAIQLGSAVLDAESLAERAADLALWRSALSDQGDILLYGCNVAAVDDGRQFVDRLAELTGADVAASDDLTGGAAAGGDWMLEYTTGAIEATGIDAAEYLHTLDTIVGTNGNDTLVAPGYPNLGAHTMYGLAGNDSITGGINNDFIDGGSGSDTLRGGLGNDTYVVDSSGDVIVESNNNGGGGDGAGLDGIDLIQSSVSWTLDALVENLTLTGDANISGRGSNSVANHITGNNANNTLDGGRTTIGSPADTLSGAGGNDTYLIASGDTVVEAAGGGFDTVRIAANYTLGAEVEGLVILGSTGRTGTGNTLYNALTGGDGNDVLSGLAGNDTLDGGAGADVMIGGTGSDTYYVDALDTVAEQAGEGTADRVISVLGWTLGDHVERLELSGSAHIAGHGNAIANHLLGNTGDNTLDGGGAADTLEGGGGNDYYIVDDAADVVLEAPGGGTDTVESGVSWTLGADQEHLLLTGVAAIAGAGNALANAVTGNGAGNTLSGGAGADTLDGGDGADQLAGGEGNDVYHVGTGDVVVESSGEGTDTVHSAVGWTLGAHMEHLVLTTAAPLRGTGNTLDNAITGNAGNDTLDGDAGSDTLAGGQGDDSYVVDSAGDVLVEDPSAGVDSVRSSVSWQLGAGLEHLLLDGVDPLSGTGNENGNAITGNAAANTLAGAGGDDTLDGGVGADSLSGGSGDDLFLVDDSGDLVTESANEGMDRIESLVGYSLPANVEWLLLTGSADIAGTGNAQANRIDGNGGGNTLDGGPGADSLSGGAGNDTYVVDDAGDAVAEPAGAGHDAVVSAVSWTLGTNLESLTLSGGGDTSATGNGLANSIFGNGGSNLLDGRAGADTMTGGPGDDIYVFDSAGDLAVEAYAAGTDTVRSARATTRLSPHVENLVLLGTTAIEAYGNGLANQLDGNVLGNVLDGGAGADTMSGNKGDDTYYVDNANDVIVERLGEGVDAVWTTVSFSLAGGGKRHIEELKLAGDAPIDGSGNARSNYIEGNDAANRIDGGIADDVMEGLGGDDTYIVDFAEDVVIEESGEGTDTVESSVSYTLPDNVEHLVLTGTGDIDGTGNALANAITGNAGDNRLAGLGGADTLTGGAGDDVLDGGTGADAMTGGTGDDTYVVDDALDAVTELPGEGRDLVQSSRSYTLGSDLEHLMLLGSGNFIGNGNELSNQLIGNDGNNLLRGFGGDDLLKGGDLLDGTSGEDTLVGGAGHDLYYVDSAGDVVTEFADGGTDTVYTIYNGYVLPAQVENVVYFDPLVLFVTGNGLNNHFTGNDADNTLDGAGGADTLAGAGGDDTYIVEDAGDRVIEAGDAGEDSVASSVDYTLTGNVENLALTGVAQSGTGNTLDNTVEGNAEANALDGAAGADTMAGGDGDDLYYVDDAEDEVIEAAPALLALGARPEPGAVGTGIDTVISQVSYTLRANVENLELAAGAGRIDGSGNVLDNLLFGNGSANALRGLGGVDILDGGGGNDTLDGGTGRDTLGGGTGDDTYVVTSGDAVLEYGGEGEDTVRAALSWTLDRQLEQLVLTGANAVSGTGNTQANALTGNTAANLLRGLEGNDTLSGGGGADTLAGGAGNDELRGGAGADAFLLDGPLAGNVDTLVDYAPGTDRIRLDDDVYGAFSQGTAVQAAQIRAGAGFTTATTAEHRLIYNSTNGALYYDADGAGGAAAVRIATIATVPATLSTEDFLIVA